MTDTILIVEDEQDMVSALEYNLQQEGYDTRGALTGKDALELALKEPVPDLVLLDLMLPDISGYEVGKRLRDHESTRDIPIIMVTARGEDIDRVLGLELGADDYVVKPFNVRELMLRIKAVLRRSKPVEKEHPRATFGQLTIDVPGHRIWVGEVEVSLTLLEFRLLETLYERRGRVQSRDTLLTDVWSIEADVTTRTVDTHIKRLRQKLGSASDYIETIRGVGYRFRQNPE